MNATQSADRTDREPRGLLDRPAFDWLLVGVIVFVVLRWTSLVDLFTGTSHDGQRSAMSSIASVLGTIAGFAVAALFFYAALDNPATRYVRAQWGGQVAGVFLRALIVMFLASVTCGFTVVSVPDPTGAIVFLVATLAGFAKLGRLLLVVAALLHGQHHDAQGKPIANLRQARRNV